MNAVIDALHTYGLSAVIVGLLIYVIINGEVEFRYPRKFDGRGRRQ